METTDILELHGTNFHELTIKILNTIDLNKLIIDKQTQIIIKPDIKTINGVFYSTTPVILATLLKYLQDNKFTNIALAFGSYIGEDLDNLLEKCKYSTIIKKFNVPILGNKEKDYTKKTIGGTEYTIIKKCLNAPFFINLVTSAQDETTIFHNALQAMQTILHEKNRDLFNDNPNFYKSIAFLNYLVRANLVIVEPDSLSDIQASKKLYATLDNLLADAYYANTLEMKPFEVEYIELSSKLGIGCADVNKANIINLIDNTKAPTNNRAKLASYINDSSPCEDCYNNLLTALSMLDKEQLLDKLKEKVFIGQGWREFSEDGIGIGRCTALFKNYVMGCPPAPEKTYNYLKELITKQ